MAASHDIRRVLILGGGDGMAAREVLRYPAVESLTLVDLDPEMTDLFRSHALLRSLNDGALHDPRLTVHNRDAMLWLEERIAAGDPPFDVVIVDLPDPNSFGLGKLYSRTFYRLLGRAMTAHGAAVVQATSPYLAPRSFWCIVRTLAAAELSTAPYHAHVPSFGDWGFVLVTNEQLDTAQLDLRRDDLALRFLTRELLPTLFAFPADQPMEDVEVNRLNDQLLVRYYEDDLHEQGVGRRLQGAVSGSGETH